MFAPKRRLGGRARAMSFAGAFVATGLGVGLAGCASHHHISEAPPHPIAVEVTNNITVPTELTVFVAQDQGGSRQMLGTVPGAQTKTFTFTPLSWGQPYRLEGRRPLGGSVFSPRFTVTDPETGTVSWNVVPNQVQFYNSVVDTVAAPAKHDSTSAAKPNGN
jgi:hypothetical protein